MFGNPGQVHIFLPENWFQKFLRKIQNQNGDFIRAPVYNNMP